MKKTINRAILVTGSSSGIGAELCRQLSMEGYGFVVHGRHNQSGCEGIVREIQDNGGKAVIMLGDLSENGVARKLVEFTLESFGRIDWVVANAGFPTLKSLDDGNRTDMEYAFRGNLFSFFDLVQAARPHIGHSNQPRIVALGSFTAHLFRTDMRSFPMSSASKGALETMVRALALELAQECITINAVIPGYIEKDAGTQDGVSVEELEAVAKKIPLGRVGKPAEVVSAIRYLLSREAGYITGQMLHVNGGLVV